MRPVAISLVLFALAIPLWSQNDLVRLKREYTIIAEKLKPHTDGFVLDEDVASVDLLERKWQLTADWIAAWLDGHPNATEKQVEKAIVLLDREMSVSVVLLAPHTYLVATQDGEIGTVFVVGADAGQLPHYRVKWTIREVQLGHEKEFAAWTAQRASGGCREKRDEEEMNCGPLFAVAVRLPNNADGHARFYLDGEYAQAAGATVRKQFSIWQWDGRKATPLLAKSFGFMIEQARGTELKGDVLHVGEKGFFRSFFGCGSCEERQLDWMIRITPTGVEDLGEKSLVPELDVLDQVVYELARGESAEREASPQVIEFLKPIVGDAKQDSATASDDKDYFSLGMLDKTKVTRQGSDTFLCFSTDDVGPLRFRMQRSGSSFFLQNVEDLSEQGENACKH